MLRAAQHSPLHGGINLPTCLLQIGPGLLSSWTANSQLLLIDRSAKPVRRPRSGAGGLACRAGSEAPRLRGSEAPGLLAAWLPGWLLLLAGWLGGCCGSPRSAQKLTPCGRDNDGRLAVTASLRVLGCLRACFDCRGFGRVLVNSCEAVSNFACRCHLRGVMGCGASSTGSRSSSGGSRQSDHLAVAARNRGDNPLTAVFHAPAHASSPLRRIIFVRHASAAPPPTAADTGDTVVSSPGDLERALTGRGRQQCALARDSWMSGVQPCLAITSQAARTAETLALTLPQLEPARVRVLAQLHPSRCGPDCAAMLGALGPGGPLRRYRADTSLGIDGVSAFHNYGVDVCGGSGQQANLHSLLTTAARLGRDGGGDTVVIFGHAVLLVAVAVAVARAMGCSAAVVEQLLDCELGECEGIALTCQQPPHGHSFVEHLSSAGG
eukprot:COSAG01_NODE_495_length_16308_cov_92.317088_3_plen_437_part_00